MSMSSSIDKVLEDYLASEPHKRYDSFVPLDFDQENYGMTQTKMLRWVKGCQCWESVIRKSIEDFIQGRFYDDLVIDGQTEILSQHDRAFCYRNIAKFMDLELWLKGNDEAIRLSESYSRGAAIPLASNSVSQPNFEAGGSGQGAPSFEYEPEDQNVVDNDILSEAMKLEEINLNIDSDELKEMKFMEIDPNSAAAAGSSGVQPEPEKTKLKKSRREESEFLKKEFNLHSESSTSSQEDDDDYNPSGKKRKTHVSRSKRSKKLPNKEGSPSPKSSTKNKEGLSLTQSKRGPKTAAFPKKDEEKVILKSEEPKILKIVKKEKEREKTSEKNEREETPERERGRDRERHRKREREEERTSDRTKERESLEAVELVDLGGPSSGDRPDLRTRDEGEPRERGSASDRHSAPRDQVEGDRSPSRGSRGSASDRWDGRRPSSPGPSMWGYDSQDQGRSPFNSTFVPGYQPFSFNYLDDRSVCLMRLGWDLHGVALVTNNNRPVACNADMIDLLEFYSRRGLSLRQDQCRNGGIFDFHENRRAARGDNWRGRGRGGRGQRGRSYNPSYPPR